MSIERQYLDLLVDIIANGVEKDNRTGTKTVSVFGRQVKHKMSEGFPLLTTKKMAWRGIVSELLWFLKGETNLTWLVKNNNYIWVGDAYKYYYNHQDISEPLTREEFIEKIKIDDEFAEIWGELGSIYGKQWRKWEKFIIKPGMVYLPNGSYNQNFWDVDEPIDQIQNLINTLRTNPDDRRMLVSAWNVGEIDKMRLPPCHYGFQVSTRELSSKERLSIYKSYPRTKIIDIRGGTEDEKNKLINSFLNKYAINIPKRAISLLWNQRSVDAPLGLPFNIASYALLLKILGKLVNMVPDELIGNLGDTHVYENQLDGIKEQLSREPYPFPKLEIKVGIEEDETIDSFLEKVSIDDFVLKDYECHPKIVIPLSN